MGAALIHQQGDKSVTDYLDAALDAIDQGDDEDDGGTALTWESAPFGLLRMGILGWSG